MQQVKSAIDKLLPGQSFILGSGQNADVVITDMALESQHACFRRRENSVLIQDLDTRSGTFINSIEVRGLVPITHGDQICLGNLRFRYSSQDMGSEPHSRGLSITLKNATKTVSVSEGAIREKRNILDNISLHIAKGEFVGILGSSGSGKSTLIKSFAGLSKLSQGEFSLDNEAVESQRLLKDRRIAYLPQDVVIHETLTTGSALSYIARIKEIGNSDQERRQTIDKVLSRVGMQDRINVRIDRLSGGQRKRVALAAELLGDPEIILLDEATSGLDPATEAELMQLFRSLADEGRTVICITHFPGRLALCDRLLYLMQGRLIFNGTPDELTNIFQVNQIEDVYLKQSSRSPADWQVEFTNSPPGQRAAAEIQCQTVITKPDTETDQPPTREAYQTQIGILSQRYFELQRADWQYLLLLLLQAPVIGLMIAVTFGSIRASFAELHAADTKEVIFLLVLAVLWCSGTASVRELVKEEKVLQHETRFGVQLLPYLLSKLLLLGILSVIQAMLLLSTVVWFTELTGSNFMQASVLISTAVVGVILGLAVSSFAGTSERAMTVLPVILIAQAIFSGGLSRLEGLVLYFAQIFVTAYWSLDGIRATFGSALKNATYPGAPGHFQPPILGPGGPILLDFLALLLQGLLLLGCTYTILHLKNHRSLPHFIRK